MPSARSLWMTCSVIPTLRIMIFIAGSEFLCSRKSFTPCSAHACAASPMPSISHFHESRVGRLERVVVALDPGPDDVVRAERAGEVAPATVRSTRLARGLRVGADEPAAAERRVQVHARGDAVDVVVAERVAHLVEVVLESSCG